MKVRQSFEAIADVGTVFVELIKNWDSSSDIMIELASKLASILFGYIFIEAAIRIIANPFKIYYAFNSILYGFKNKKYYDAGNAMGDMFGTILDIYNLSLGVID